VARAQRAPTLSKYCSSCFAPGWTRISGIILRKMLARIFLWFEFPFCRFFLPSSRRVKSLAALENHRRIGMTAPFLPTLSANLARRSTKTEIQTIEKIRAQHLPQDDSRRSASSPARKQLLQYFDKVGARWALATSGERSQVDQLLRTSRSLQRSR